MRITSKSVPPRLRSLTRRAVKFFVEKIPKEKDFSFDLVHVEFVRSADNHMEAWCEPFSYGGLPTEFDISLNSQLLPEEIEEQEYTKILFHELTHAWQYATGTLVSKWEDRVVFRKKKHYLNEEYFLLPWEVEAFGYEHCMNAMFWDAQEPR